LRNHTGIAMGANDCCCGKMNTAEGCKAIGVASTVISVLSLIGFIWKFVQLQKAEDTLRSLFNSILDPELQSELDKQKHILAAMIGIALVCIIVAIALIFAARKGNKCLALPFMIWWIIVQIAAGIFAAILIFILAVVDWGSLNEENFSKTMQIYVVPTIFTIIFFILHTWWLVVVFNFYRLLKSGHAFDSIPMQAA